MGRRAAGIGSIAGAEQASVAPARRSQRLWDAASSARRIDVLGLAIENQTLGEATRWLVSEALAGRRTRAVFVNAHVMNCAWADAGYLATVASADCRFADGSGMAIAARLAGSPLGDNVNGTDMLPLLAAEAAGRGATIYLLGGAPGAAAGSAAMLARLGHGAAIAGTHHGYVAASSIEEATAIAAINASGASIVLVGMGVPLQDQWIEHNAHRLDAKVLIGVGGLFDFFAGRVSRAPAALRSLGLEWTWRLAQEPSRMWRRYVFGNVTFLARALVDGLRVRGRSQVALPGRAPAAR